MIWISIIGIGVGLIFLALFCRKYYNDNYGDGS